MTDCALQLLLKYILNDQSITKNNYRNIGWCRLQATILLNMGPKEYYLCTLVNSVIHNGCGSCITVSIINIPHTILIIHLCLTCFLLVTFRYVSLAGLVMNA